MNLTSALNIERQRSTSEAQPFTSRFKSSWSTSKRIGPSPEIIDEEVDQGTVRYLKYKISLKEKKYSLLNNNISVGNATALAGVIKNAKEIHARYPFYHSSFASFGQFL